MMKGIDGLEMEVLKRMKAPDEQASAADSGAYDYIMMAEIEKLQVFMELMRSRGDSRLESFGDMMKEHAGSPYINVYNVIAETEEGDD
jgi:hypothetical protein